MSNEDTKKHNEDEAFNVEMKLRELKRVLDRIEKEPDIVTREQLIEVIPDIAKLVAWTADEIRGFREDLRRFNLRNEELSRGVIKATQKIMEIDPDKEP